METAKVTSHCKKCGNTSELTVRSEDGKITFTYDKFTATQTPMQHATKGDPLYDDGGCCYKAACQAITSAVWD
jgi:hypothetical protein